MKKLLSITLVSASLLTGCAYGGIAMNASGDTVAIARNDALLFGLLRKVFICKASDAGVTKCVASEESP